MKIYPICVPTYKRGFYHTMKYLSNSGLEVFYYCQPEDYKVNYAHLEGTMSNATFITDTPCGVANARNHIIQDQLKRGNHKIYMMDDDVKSFGGIRRRANPTSKTFNEIYKMEPVDFFTTWQKNIPDDCVASGPSWSGFNGMAKNICNQESIRHLDGRMFFDIGVLNDNGIVFEQDTFENRDVCLEILKHNLPVPIMHGMLETGVPVSNAQDSTLWNIQGHNSKKWADNLQAKWGTELIAVTQNKNGFWGPKFRLSISKMKEYFGYESDAIVGFNLK